MSEFWQLTYKDGEKKISMIYGVGIDLIEVSRVEKQLKQVDGLVKDLFTNTEIKYCSSKANSARHYAGIFACKEALLKAFGTGLQPGYSYSQIEVDRDELGKPIIRVTGELKQKFREVEISTIHGSISHTKSMATAIVTLEVNKR